MLDQNDEISKDCEASLKRFMSMEHSRTSDMENLVLNIMDGMSLVIGGPDEAKVREHDVICRHTIEIVIRVTVAWIHQGSIHR